MSLLSVLIFIVKRLVILASHEKNLNPFSWFPSRSPRRNTRSLAPENVNRAGVIMPSDTLHSLAAGCKDRVPLFVRTCIEYIEEVGSGTCSFLGTFFKI